MTSTPRGSRSSRSRAPWSRGVHRVGSHSDGFRRRRHRQDGRQRRDHHFTRILSHSAFRAALFEHSTRSEADVAWILMVWTGRLRRRAHFARNRLRQQQQRPGRRTQCVSPRDRDEFTHPARDIGRPAMVENIADGIRAAMADAGTGDPADVHYVQTKMP